MHTDTLISVRSPFAPDVSFKVNFWGKQSPEDQLRVVLYGWTQVTGLNWEHQKAEQMEAHDDWRGFRVTHPVYNRANCEFVWQV